MAKKKVKNDIVPQDDEQKQSKTFEMKATVDVLMSPKHWALKEGLNPLLFELWKDSDPVSKEDFEKLKEQVM